LKAMEIMDEPDFFFIINEVGKYFKQQLSHLDFITNVRGFGLMIGATLYDPQTKQDIEVATEFVKLALKHGFVINNTTSKDLRFLPPLICSKADVDLLINSMPEIYKETINA
ncbi:MAG: aminotransferase class III-fold pyridoxal phosphate-dependent enzyme, partial [Coriobacteriales bacterium]|nr:aminotransferase class III-fold pyridoxal phosphate-dependent enzyme [Coriobacteriales bacterium]